MLPGFPRVVFWGPRRRLGRGEREKWREEGGRNEKERRGGYRREQERERTGGEGRIREKIGDEGEEESVCWKREQEGDERRRNDQERED